ncbi:SDR family oxidoreductase [Achromobacter sp.]|uniref:SDR family oxidoreductase n=1 Tax=Achromobacter sp. TaxID=134375 RepID=UPI0028A692D7|nr:SDR family oxidoreductase [Achromobacter sp.]
MTSSAHVGGTAVITGGSHGIGRATAIRLAADGMQCIVTVDRVPPKNLLPGERYIQADLLDPASRDVALAILGDIPDPAVLVNNVAIVKLAPVDTLSLADLQTSVDLNVAAALLCTQAVLPAMKRRGYGRIVNISSRSALGKELRSAYTASKAALIGMTRTWALELAPCGITVNCVGPGPVATEMFRAANPDDSPQTRKIMQTIPVGRLGAPEEIAHAVACFAHPMAGFITGQVIYACGGMTVGLTHI